jgi:CubicO group peptidase (beta-lactamase class C family)
MISRVIPTWLFVISVCVTLAVPGRAIADEAGTGPQYSKGLGLEIDRLAQLAMREAHLAGMSIAIGRNGQLLYASGFGFANLETQTPASADTVYRIGSLTKQFTAVAVLHMTERGAMALDKPIGTYVPELTSAAAFRLDELLWHTSGLASFEQGVMPDAFRNRETEMPRPQLLRFLDNASHVSPAGQASRYGNTGYLLAGLALERVSGEGYAELIEKDVIVPAGLVNTRYDSVSAIIPGRAAGYVGRGSDFSNAAWNSPSRPFSAGALVSTATDLVRWNDALYRGSLLTSESRRLMITPGRLANGASTPFGFGVRIDDSDGRKRIYHGGAIIGFSALLTHYPDEHIDIAILTNTQGRGKALQGLEKALLSAVLSAPHQRAMEQKKGQD